MSGSEEAKKAIKILLVGSPMPDFEAERNCIPSPLLAESKLKSPNKHMAEICNYEQSKDDNWDSIYVTSCGKTVLTTKHNDKAVYCSYCGGKLRHV